MRTLNEQQKQAVEHFQGPALVLAGPGSGKTFTITERIQYLVREKGVMPGNILVITFTKAAAAEMKQRYLREGGRNGVQFGTFHAVFFTILKHAYHYTVNNIVRDEVRYQILRELVNETDLEIQDEAEFLADLTGEISRVKGERMDLDHYYSTVCPGETFRKIYRKYQKALERKRLLDFDDMLVYCYELLEQRPDICALWQQKYPYILVDEFQDINRVQYDTVKLLAAPSNHLFVVGDDDQSIYGFRGAKPDIMQQFLVDYPDALVCRLGTNYRCSGQVVQAAGKLIANNHNRMSKEIVAAKEEGKPLEYCNYEKSVLQNEAIRDRILALRQQGVPYKEMAVLFRTNPQARGLTGKLMEFNIPFVLKEHLPNLYDHWIAKDILAYLQVARGERRRSQVMRIINRPKRYVHRNAFTEPYADFEELKLFYEDKDWMVDRIEQLQSDLSVLATLKPYPAVNFIRKGIGYDEYLREYAEYRGIRAEDMLDILEEIQEEARDHETIEEWFSYMQQYGEALKEQQKTAHKKENEDAVQLLTMHGAKGLEFEVVFIPDVNEGVTPHNKAVLEADVEEERRLFYVAMTRAKDLLCLSSVQERLHKEADPSRFLDEIFEDIRKR
ncbi:MAG: ATP-dependent helicase [Lachnospiraceae bacterium]|nr:ATP-dependent helicase [Lachnospiraceae bacterium]